MAARILNPFDAPIDLATADGRKIYKDSTKPLDTKFTGSSDTVMSFKTQVTDAAESRSWR